MKTESSQSSPDFQSIVDEFMEGFAFQVPYDGSNDFYNKELLNLRPYIERELKIIWDKYIQKLPSIDQNEIPQDIKKALRNRWELVTQSSPVETPVRSAEEILKEKLKNIYFIRSDETYALVIEAMTEYAAQFKPSVVGDKEEQRFTIEDMREAFDASWTTYCPFDEWIKTRKQ